MKGNVSPIKILHRLNAEYGQETKYSKFFEGQKNAGQPSAGEIMASVFCDSGVIHVDFPPHGITITAQYYSNLLNNYLHQGIQKKRRGKLSEIIQLHDSAHSHTANLTNMTFATVGWKFMNHPLCRVGLTTSDFNFVKPMKVHLGQKFQTDWELKCSVLNWLHSQVNNFMLLASVTF
jgi:hypothetical protein